MGESISMASAVKQFSIGGALFYRVAGGAGVGILIYSAICAVTRAAMAATTAVPNNRVLIE